MNAIFCFYDREIIGIDGKLPSEVIKGLKDEPAVKADMKFFRHVTMGKTVVMGRKTWDSLDRKPLKGRTNIIITSNPEKLAQENPLFRYQIKGDVVNYITKEQFEKYYMYQPDVWIIGGVSLLKEYIPYCDQVYFNEISAGHKYPEINEIEENRVVRFPFEEIIDILYKNSFIKSNTGIITDLLAKEAPYPQEDEVNLWRYNVYKRYDIGWNE